MNLPIQHVLEQHCDEASFLWSTREAAFSAPHYNLSDLARLDGRIKANIQGIALAQGAGLSRCIEELQTHDPGSVFTALAVAVRQRDSASLRRILDILEPGDVEEAGATLGWLEWSEVSRFTQSLASSPDSSDIERRIALISFGCHRQHPGTFLEECLGSSDSDLRCEALRVAGVLRCNAVEPRVNEMLNSTNSNVCYWAAWASMFLSAKKGIAKLREFVDYETVYAPDAILLVCRTLDVADAGAWLRKLAQSPIERRIVIQGMGAAGDSAYIPSLIRQLDSTEYSRIAGAAIESIVGLKISGGDFEGHEPDDFEAGPNDDPDDVDVSIDEDEHLAWPDQARIARWWESNSKRFPAGFRYICGSRISEQICSQTIRDGLQSQRIAACYELALIQPDDPLFDWRAPGFRQQANLGLAQTLA